MNFLDSVHLSGVSTAPTAAPSTATTQLATTAFVQGELSPINTKNSNQDTALATILNHLKIVNVKEGTYNNKIVYVSNNPTNITYNSVNYSGYSTINAAITAEYSAGNILNIFVLPGTYKESINIIGKTVNIIGVDKNTCIVTNDQDYNSPPFNIAGGNKISNLTINVTDDGVSSYTNLAYCVHNDADITGESIIDNCIMHSYQSACIGFGTRGNSPIRVMNCQMFKHANARLSGHASFNNGVVYGHNCPINQATNEWFYMTDCYLEAETGYSIYIFNANRYYPGGGGASPDFKLMFANNTVWSRTEGVPKKLAPNYLTEVVPSYKYFGGSTERLEGCTGNGPQFMNYKNAQEPMVLKDWTTCANGWVTMADYMYKYNYLLFESILVTGAGAGQNYTSMLVPVNFFLSGTYKVSLYSGTPPAFTTAYYFMNFVKGEDGNEWSIQLQDYAVGSSWSGFNAMYRVSGVY